MIKYYNIKIFCPIKIQFAIIIGLLSFIQQNISAQIEDVIHWESVIYNDATFSYRISADAETALNWRNSGFDDSAWETAQGGIGYGDNDDNTIIPASISVFLRTRFTISDTSEIGAAALSISYDDAFVAYLNGIEIARSSGLSDAYPAYSVESSVSHEAAMLNGGVPESFIMDENVLKAWLKEGENVLTVQVHNTGMTSSDLSSNVWFNVGLKTDETRYLAIPEWFTPPVPTVFSSNLPIMVIETENSWTIPDEPKINAHMGLIDNGPDQSNKSNDPFNGYDGQIGIELRGNSTQGFPKKPYNFETRDAMGENLNVSLLGMPAENDWVLRASYMDHTFIRNSLADFMSRETGRWASRTKHVEVILNGEYAGIYVLMEDLKRDNNRLDIARLDTNEISGEDLTGGYIWEITGFDEHFGERRKIKYPKIDDVRPEQLQYIQSVDDAFRNKMSQASAIYENPNTGYVEHINVESYLFEALVHEAMRNSDAYGWSGYYHKDKNDLIHAGPVWDFDQSAGNSSYPDNGVVSGWMMEHPSTSSTPFYWPLLLNESFFRYSLKLRWEEMRDDKFSDTKLMAYIDSIANYLSEAQNHEFSKWPVLGANIWRETYGYEERDTYQKEVDYLKLFLAERWAWMDAQLEPVQRPSGYPDITLPGAFSDTILYLSEGTYLFDLDDIFAYPYTSGLSYMAGSDQIEIIQTDIKAKHTLALIPNALGTSNIYLKAKDTYGNSKTTSFIVEVKYSVHTGFLTKANGTNTQMLIYPNPATAYVNIQLTGNGGINGRLSISNLAGQTIETINISQGGKFIYPTEKLEHGVYLLTARMDDGSTYNGKLIIK